MYAFWRIVEFFALCLWTGEEYGVFVLVRLLQMMVCNRRSNCQTSTIRQKMGIFWIILRVGGQSVSVCMEGGRWLPCVVYLCLSCLISRSLSGSFSIFVQGTGFISLPLGQWKCFLYPHLPMHCYVGTSCAGSAIGPTEACQFCVVAAASLLATTPWSLCIARFSCASYAYRICRAFAFDNHVFAFVLRLRRVLIAFRYCIALEMRTFAFVRALRFLLASICAQQHPFFDCCAVSFDNNRQYKCGDCLYSWSVWIGIGFWRNNICAFMVSSKIAMVGARHMTTISFRFSNCHYFNVMGGVISLSQCHGWCHVTFSGIRIHLILSCTIDWLCPYMFSFTCHVFILYMLFAHIR